MEIATTDCPALENTLGQKWDMWSREHYKRKQSVRNGEFYYELSQWNPTKTNLGKI